ncbi:hypothetical protein [Methanolobus bombayensis]|uniref:hypothetical protein n=1 Tax=Methanolobus bombayensis TaxID=38023 RepID=UPI001AE48B41|nr:hypothetical protein [Methanolobus bombayensis]MBP1910057.1 hypothetical protein [Methanolobus bombayensis]
MSEKTIIPLLNKSEVETETDSNVACNSCGGGCCGGMGIKAGSDKEVVFRNIFLYVGMGAIIFIVAYLATKLISWINP